MAEAFQAHVRPEGPSLPEADRHKEVEGEHLGDSWLHSYSGVSLECWRKCRVLRYFKGILVSVFMTGAHREHNARKATHGSSKQTKCLLPSLASQESWS